MSRVTEGQIRHLARLAALDLPAEVVPALTDQIGRILEYVSQLEAVDIEAASDGARAGGLGLRPDVPQAPQLHVPLGQNAPVMQDGCFVVPRVPGLEDE